MHYIISIFFLFLWNLFCIFSTRTIVIQKYFVLLSFIAWVLKRLWDALPFWAARKHLPFARFNLVISFRFKFIGNYSKILFPQIRRFGKVISLCVNQIYCEPPTKKESYFRWVFVRMTQEFRSFRPQKEGLPLEFNSNRG